MIAKISCSFFILLPNLVFSSYLIYPKLESGKNSLQLYDAFLTESVHKRFYLSSFVLSNFEGDLDYGYLLGLSMDKYGELSVSYIERELGIVDSGSSYKESAYSIVYQYQISIVSIIFGGNFSDVFHNEFFEFQDNFLWSFNIGLKIKPHNSFLIEIATLNLGKESSNTRVIDDSEYFYFAFYLFFLDNLSLKSSFHVFKRNRIMSNIFLSYSMSSNVSFDAAFFSEPISFFVGSRFRFYLFSLKLGGTFGIEGFHAFFALSFFIEPAKRSRLFSGLIDLSASDHSGYMEASLDLININTVNEKELTLLPGIGRTLAKRIIEYRKAHGNFYTADEIINVKGISIRKFQKFKDLITIGKVDESKRLARLGRWTMKDFIDLGFPPSLSLRLVLYIKKNYPFKYIESLFRVEGFSYEMLEKLRLRLKKHGYKDP